MKIEKACHDEEYIWYITKTDNYLYELKKGEKTPRELELISNEVGKTSVFSNIYHYLGDLYLIPSNVNYIIRYQVEKKEIKRYYLPVDLETITKNAFVSALLVNHQIWILGDKYEGIIRIDLESGKTYIINDYIEQREKLRNCDCGDFPVESIDMGEYFLIPFMNCNAVLKLYKNEDKTEVIEVGEKISHYRTIKRCGEYIFLAPQEISRGGIIKWSLIDKKWEVFNNYPTELKIEDNIFYRSILYNDKLILFTLHSNHNILVDVNCGEMELFTDLYDVSDKLQAKYKYMELIGDRIFFVNNSTWGYYHLKTKRTENFRFNDSDRMAANNFEAKIRNQIEKDDWLIRENKQVDLAGYMNWLRFYEKTK